MLWLLLVACGGIDAASVTAEVDAIVTVVHVSWSTSDLARGRVEYGPTDTYGWTTPLGAEGETHRATILGLRAESAYHFRVVAEIDGVETVGADNVVTTGVLPDEVARFTVEVPSDDERYLLTSQVPGEGEESTIYVIDAEGFPVWYAFAETGIAPAARLTAAGDAVFYVQGVRDDTSTGELVITPLDGSASTTVGVPGAHHDVIELPDGAFATIAAEVREIEGERIAGDAIVEVTRDGAITEVWNAFDHLPVVENANWSATIDDAIDWTHGNGLAYVEDEDAYYLSLYSTSSIVKVARTGDTLWQLGGAFSDFDIVGDVAFGPQHSPEPFPGGVRFFDNGASDTGSRVVEYLLDEAAFTATWSWEWRPTDRSRSIVLGDVSREDDGSALVTWGAPGAVFGVDPDGELTWHAEFAGVGALGQSTRISSLYP